jgi:iron complex transport system substrate-binding protein
MGSFTSMGLAREVTDFVGRQVTVPDSPVRVVSLAPSVTEIVFALGQAYRLKGVSQFSDYPPAARALYRVGSYVNPDLERIVALKPDLCIGTRDGNPKALVMRLTDLGIPVYVVAPRSLDSVIETVEKIGALLAAQGPARRLAASLRARIDRVAHRVAGIKRRPRVFIQIGVSPIVSAGSHTLINELIERAGGVNVVRSEAAYPRFNREQVLAMAPEVIIITSMVRGVQFRKLKAQWAAFPGLPAAEHHRIYLADADLLDRPSPRLVEGLEHLVRLIHPELFEGGP